MSTYEGVGFSNSASIPDDLFLLNPFNQKTVTGRMNIGYALRRFGCGGVLITLFALFMIGITIPPLLTEYRLATSKTGQTKAEITDHRISSGKSTSYYVTYQYTVSDQIYSQEDSVSRDAYYNYEVGGHLPVTYVADEPDISHIGENGIHWNSLVPMFFIDGFFLLMAVLLTWGQIPQYRKIRRMRREGQLILGELRGAGGEMIRRGSGKSRRTDYDVTIRYGFTTPTGKKMEGEKTVTRNDLKKKVLQTSGSVAVLYVNDDDYLVL